MHPCPGQSPGLPDGDTRELGAFLASAERRALQTGPCLHFGTKTTHLDVVQDAMLKLSEHYSRPPRHRNCRRCLQEFCKNSIHDFFRRQKVRSTLGNPAVGLSGSQDSDEDPLETLEAAEGTSAAESAADHAERAQIVGIIEQEIANLPARQRQAFLLRYWEDMDVAETAATMGCSEGSVKTHCSRATHALAQALLARGITL